MDSRDYHIKALTDIWTGDLNGKPDRTITTGLLGSVRWWCEVLVRGLGGHACDPTRDGNRCPDKEGKHCVVCELFGCTGWARKFRFEILDTEGKVKQAQITQNKTFTFRFTPLRPIRNEEWASLDLTLRLIAEYSAIGGKTVYKPSDEQSRQDAPHHKDYGLVQIIKRPEISPVSEQNLRRYVTDSRWRKPDHDGFAWASLTNFWCVKGRYLARQDSQKSTFNRVIGRPEPKRQPQSKDSQSQSKDSWLAGRRASRRQLAESKKVFSFKDPPRTFGFVEEANNLQNFLQSLQQNLQSDWQDFRDEEFKHGSKILASILDRD